MSVLYVNMLVYDIIGMFKNEACDLTFKFIDYHLSLNILK